jgi:integral membrane protein (TIGR01906 family)
VRRHALALVIVLVAVLVPPLLVTSALRIVANGWIVSFEYGRGGVPADRYGLSLEERSELARLGLESISPGGRGIALLAEARLPDGEPAFNARELTHMQDVRDAFGIAMLAQAALLALVAAAALALAERPATRSAVPRGLRAGAVATLTIAAALGLFMLVAWDSFFVRFHGVFFDADTWRFPSTDTLIRLYPDEFWIGVAAWIAALTVALSLVLWGLATWWLRRLPEEPAG